MWRVSIRSRLGNAILGVLGALYFVSARWIRYALYIEGAHLCEHIALTFCAYYVGKPIGLSTLFGQAALWGQEAAVGWRVSWHFVMNLLPLPFVMTALMQAWSASAGGTRFKAR